MPLISLADGLEHARKHRYALGAFNVLDSHFLRALFAAAKQERSPFIINIAEVHFKYVSWSRWSKRSGLKPPVMIFRWCSTSITACISRRWYVRCA